MMNNTNLYRRELKEYRALNHVAEGRGVVLFGSTFAKEMPICELKQAFGIDRNIYNRSFYDLTVFDAAAVADECVLPLEPSKVLVNLGETDLIRGLHSVTEITDACEALVKKLRSTLHCEVVVVSVCGSDDVRPAELNRRLEDMAKKCGCAYADIASSAAAEEPELDAFAGLRCFMLDRIGFCDAIRAGI